MPDAKTEAKVDDMVEDTFPASDPPSTTPSGGTRKSREMAEAHEGATGGDEPAGRATDDRHATETAAARQEGAHPAESHDATKGS